jgi:broad specificity phosphatase PhoE
MRVEQAPVALWASARGREAASLGAELARRSIDYELVVSSPTTRTLQTATSLARALDRPLTVEIDLRDWLADRHQTWLGSQVPERAAAAMQAHRGEWPGGLEQDWEPLSSVRRRAAHALQRYVGKTILVVTLRSSSR